MDANETNDKKIQFVQEMVNKAYPRVPSRSEDGCSCQGAAYMGFDNYVESLNFEVQKYKAGVRVSPNYMLEKINSMRNRFIDSINMLDCAEEALTGKNPKTIK